MPGFGGMCCVYDDDAWLPLMVEGCYDVVDRLFFLISDHPWSGQHGDNARTIEVIRSCPDPDNKLEIVRGSWTEEIRQRDAGLEICERAGLRYCFVVDADEVWDPKVLGRMMEAASAAPDIDAWKAQWVTYWKSYYHIIDPPEPFDTTVFIRLGRQTRFTYIRTTDARMVGQFSRDFGVFHHLSYVRTDEQLSKKITRYSHAHQILPQWFEEKWRGWDPETNNENLHPMWPTICRRAIPQDPRCYPPVLRRRVEQDELAAHASELASPAGPATPSSSK